MKMTNLLNKTMFFVVAVATVYAANAAEIGRSVQNSANTARMPTLSVMTINTMGNPAVTTVQEPAAINHYAPTPTPVTPDCADGGVKNTEYTVSMCMADLRLCVNGGAVEGGLHGLFNDDYFARVLNGNLKICQNVVDNCLTIRKNCRYVYRTSRSVWADFRSRVLWPEYYNFVLYKTGLTPNQAKKTCLRAGGKWDSVNAECLVRVVAYNKNSPISNEWLFGIAGNNKDAEAWLKMGDSFTCNKSLFGFSLLNDTATVAATAIPGGAIVGGVIGGVTAKHKQNQADKAGSCASKEFRRELGNRIHEKGVNRILETYLKEVEDNEYWDPDDIISQVESDDFHDMDEKTCELILGLVSKVNLYQDRIDACEKEPEYDYINRNYLSKLEQKDVKYFDNIYYNEDGVQFRISTQVVCDIAFADSKDKGILESFFEKCSFVPLQLGYVYANRNNVACSHGGKCRTIEQTRNDLTRLNNLLATIGVTGDSSEKHSVGMGVLAGAGIGAAAGGVATGITAIIESNNIRCVVGNDLASVSLNKSYTIDSLKDFYVRRGFSFPDTLIPTTVVVDKASWAVACSEYAGSPEDCPDAQVVLRGNDGREMVPTACEAQGAMCLVNEDIAQTRLMQ